MLYSFYRTSYYKILLGITLCIHQNGKLVNWVMGRPTFSNCLHFHNLTQPAAELQPLLIIVGDCKGHTLLYRRTSL